MNFLKSHLFNCTQYNLWANKKITDFVRTLTAEQLNKEIISSFPSIMKTILHVWDAQQIWLDRLNGIFPVRVPGKDFNGTVEEAINGVLNSSQELISLVESREEIFFQSSLTYK